MHFVVPHGYPAYARVFHPATRGRPAGTLSWHSQTIVAGSSELVGAPGVEALQISEGACLTWDADGLNLPGT